MIFFDLLKWLSIDIYRFFRFRNEKKVHLYGIEMYVGLYGQGKTMALTERLLRLRKQYGDKIYIATNYYFALEDFHISSWADLLKDYDRPVVFAYDEIQNDFNSRDYRDFPVQLLTLLTQNRKGHGKMVLGTAQRFTRVDKVFRELTQYVNVCKTVLGRLTTVVKYDTEDYENLLATAEVSKRMKIPKKKYRFVQTDYLRSLYDSYQMLQSAKQKQYLNREEQAKIFGE